MYFKTALNTAVGERKKDFDVNEFSCPVLSTAIDFMYGVDIPVDISLEDAKSILIFSDFYQMEDLKDIVSGQIGNQLDINNIQEICELADKYTSGKLKELCCDFILSNIDKLDQLACTEEASFPVLTMLRARYSEKQKRCLVLTNQLLSINLTQTFKRRNNFTSDGDYHGYVKANIKPNMLVICNKDVTSPLQSVFTKGKIGRITSLVEWPKVKWEGETRVRGYPNFPIRIENIFSNWDLLTPPF